MLKSYIAAQTQLGKFKDHMGGLKTRFTRDEDGAALVEYTILIGLITVAAITAIIFVGSWVSTKWSTLQTNLTGH